MALLRICSLVFHLGLCAAVVFPAHSQDVTVGIRTGMVQSTVQGDLFYRSLQFEGGRVRTSFQTGVQVTGFLAVPLSDRFSVRMELQYAQKGAAVRGKWVGETCGGPLVDCVIPSLDGTYQMSLVQLPILITWHRPLGHGVGLRVLAGPSLDGLLDTRITTASLRESALPENALTPVSHQMIGGVGGVELQYDVPSAGAVRVGARYHPALTEIDVIGADSTLRSRAYAFSLGYSFEL
ncbi:MAG: outer membrane beta-barrel protein [Salinibacter sp.]